MEENLFSHPRPSCCQCQHETAEKPLKHLDFRLELIKSLLDGHVPRIDHRLFSSTSELPLRLSERPFPEPIPSHSKLYEIYIAICKICVIHAKHISHRIIVCNHNVTCFFYLGMYNHN